MYKGLLLKTAMLSICALSILFASSASALLDTRDSNYPAAIDYLNKQGVVSGYADGTFKPHHLINRAELLKIVIGAAVKTGLLNDRDMQTYSNLQCFSDIEAGQWYTNYVCYAKAKGIVSGYADGTFKPTQNINSAEAYKIMLKAFGINYRVTSPWYLGLNEKMIIDYKVSIVNDENNAATLVKREVMADLITRVMLKLDGKLEAYVSNGSIIRETTAISTKPNAPTKSITLNTPVNNFVFDSDATINFSWTADNMPKDTTYQIVYSCSNDSYQSLDNYGNTIGGTFNGYALDGFNWKGLIQTPLYADTSYTQRASFQSNFWSPMDLYCLWKVEGTYSNIDPELGLVFPTINSPIGRFTLKASLITGY